MPDQADEHVIIVGAGLAGALLACYLGRAGYRVELFERRPDPRAAGFVGGRSINLALSTRGITALEGVGLGKEVLADAIRMRGRMIHDPHGNLSLQYYSRREEEAIYSVSRGGLNVTLLDAADAHDNVTIHFNERCVDIDLEAPAATFVNERTDDQRTVPASLIIGCDGAFSAVRDAMMRRVQNFDYEQSFLAHGYKELTIPQVEQVSDLLGSQRLSEPLGVFQSPARRAGETGHGSESRATFRMEPHALHIWPRRGGGGGSMMIALPNADGSFTCTLFWPFEGGHGFSAIRSRDDVLPFFERHYPDAVPLMPTLVEDYETNPTSSLVTIRCGPWHHQEKVLLIGDAAHAIVPFYGQGMNAAFEDCRILAEMLRKEARDRGAIFEAFYRARKPDADAIADMALENFIEMRDRTASRAFRLKKKIANRLHAWFPNAFVPLYNMVTFTNIPYAEAQARSQRRLRRSKIIGWIALALMILLAMFLLGGLIL